MMVVFCILNDFFVRFCLFSFFNLCIVSIINFCIVFWCVRSSGIFSFLIYFCLCCDAPLNFDFSGVVFLEKSISMVGLFVCSWFCTISVRDPLDVMELILLNTLNTWRSSLPWNGVTLIGRVTLIDQVPLLKLLQYQSRSVFSLLVRLWKLTTDVWACVFICI